MHVHLREPGFEYKETIQTRHRGCDSRRDYLGLLHAQYKPCER